MERRSDEAAHHLGGCVADGGAVDLAVDRERVAHGRPKEADAAFDPFGLPLEPAPLVSEPRPERVGSRV